MSSGVRIARGIPSVTYCRVISSAAQQSNDFHSNQYGDVVTDGNSVTILEPGQPSSRHEVAQVLQRGISEEEVCELCIGSRAGAGMGASLNPIAACVHDAATAVLFIVGSRETKKWQFLKRTLLPFVANELFANVAEKDQQLAANYYRAQINLSAFEIQEEIITDLLRPVSRGLPLTVTAEDGMKVSGLHSETIVDEMDLRRLLLDACDNRATHTLPPGGSIDTSSAIFEFTLYQSEGESPFSAANDTARETRSRLLVVEIPSSDPLVQGGAIDVRQFEGPLLHKSLLTFLDVVKKLNTPSRAAVAPYRSSKLTHFLSELLGGNAIVVAIGQLSNGEPLISRRTLDLLGALNNAVHYPVGGKELTDVLQGLLGKYRAMLMQMQDELLHKDSDSFSAKESELTIERQLLELQQEAATCRIERHSAVEDRERMYEMAELLRAKYATVMEEKAAQSEEIAKCKEDNVTLAKTLIDKNEEFAAFKIESEERIFELESQLLASSSSIEQLQEEIKTLGETIEELKSDVANRDHTAEVLRGEIGALQQQISLKEEAVRGERDKNLELAAELLTLVNRRDLLQKEADELQAAVQNLQSQLKENRAREVEISQQLQAVQQELRRKEEELFETAKRSAVIELEAKEAKLAADQLVVECRERMLDRGTTLETARNTPKYEELQGTVKKGAKVIKELERSLRRSQADLEETRKEKESADAHLQEVREKYRRKLAAMLMHEGDAPADSYHHQYAKVHHRRNSKKGAAVAAHSKGNQEVTTSDHTPAAAADAMGQLSSTAQVQQQLLDSYNERENQLRADLTMSLEQRAAIKVAYRELFDKYAASVEFMEDNFPKSTSARMKPIAEQLKFMQADLSDGENYLEELEAQERTAIRDKMESAEQAGVVQIERLSLILATYKRNLEAAERKVVAVQQENVDLHIQIEQLIDNARSHKSIADAANATAAPIRSIESEGNAFKEFAKMLAHRSEPEQTTAVAASNRSSSEQQKEYSDLVAQLSKEILDLKTHLNIAQSTATATQKASPAPSSPAPRAVRPATLVSSLKSAEEKVLETAVAEDYENPHNFRTMKDCLQYISTLEANANVALSAQLQYAQKRTTELAMRNASLEEELRSYQSYMRDVIPQYKRQLQRMKQQLNIGNSPQSQSAAITAPAAGTSDDLLGKSDELKFPPIGS